MRPLFCLFLLFGLFVSSEGTEVYFLKEGECISLTCSKCTQENYDGLYLYHRFLDHRYHKEKEVLFFNSRFPKPSVRSDFTHKVDWNGSFSNLSITIRNLSANNEGVYRCVYHSQGKKDTSCQTYILHVKEGTEVYFLMEGEDISLTCSQCAQENYDGLYLYHRFLDHRYDEEKEVLFFNSRFSEASVRSDFTDIDVGNGSFSNLSITIRNLSANNEGVYSCVYRSYGKKDTCQTYILHVKEQKNDTIKTPEPERCHVSQNLMTAVILVCLFFSVVIAFILLFPRVKQRVKKENHTEENGPMNPQSSTEYVYEDMRKNPVYSRVGPVQRPQA
ncbi:Junctional adhesion molecule-like [Oryzias melastigma]|uniref:Junctional adhesion molecule-like n=1 Tax=Oryzias melastigma TaxID=30732 RepID=A0A834C1A5_ORYME|nr:Junctional adhesion molecule-like [Oryzias melastigma]